MSWLTDLADKAENLLNKIDQNAAAVLQEKDKKKSPSKQALLKEVIVANSQDSDIINDNKTKREDLDQMTMSQNSSCVDFSHIFETEENGETLKRGNNMMKVTSDNDVGFKMDTKIRNEEEKEMLFFNPPDNSMINVENQMLRNEIFEATNEASLLLSKLKNTEKMNETLKHKISQLEKSYSTSKRENDILQAKLDALKAVKERKQSFRNDEINELESTIRQLEQDKMNLLSKVRELEGFKITYSSMKSEFENNVESLKEQCAKLESQLEASQRDTSNALEELKNYKIRANNTLSMKDKIIENLKCESSDDQQEDASTTQITQLLSECDELRKEVLAYQLEIENKAVETITLDAKVKNLDKQLTAMRESYQQEKSAREFSEHSVNSLMKELKNLQLETGKQLSNLRLKLRDHQPKENDNPQKLGISNNFKIAESGDERYRSLTQALVAKQAALESVTADRNALRLQLEKTETKYRSDLINIRNNQPRTIHMNDTDDVKARMPRMMEESPWDSNLSRRMKKAYSSLDSFSVRIGLFLRRNPIARIFIIAYMIILHFWVFVVLFTYKPEIHD